MENELPKFAEVVLARLEECGIKAIRMDNANEVQVVEQNNSYRLCAYFRCLL